MLAIKYERKYLMFTIFDFEKYVNENRKKLQQGFMGCKEIPSFMKQSGKFETLWNTGCWLKEKLLEMGASDSEADDICFAHGQRCGGGSPPDSAIEYLNEYSKNNKIKDKPGADLAQEIAKKSFNRNCG